MDIKQLTALLNLLDETKTTKNEFWKIGKQYIVRTVTMIYVGDLKAINDTELLLENCAWIPETSRWNQFVKGEKPKEMEPYVNDVIVGRGALLDASVVTDPMKIEVL